VDVRTYTHSLLAAVGITRIVVIDDEYASLSVEDLIGICSVLDAATAAHLPHLEGISFAVEHDIGALGTERHAHGDLI
jgi:hypothetical protein